MAVFKPIQHITVNPEYRLPYRTTLLYFADYGAGQKPCHATGVNEVPGQGYEQPGGNTAHWWQVFIYTTQK